MASSSSITSGTTLHDAVLEDVSPKHEEVVTGTKKAAASTWSPITPTGTVGAQPHPTAKAFFDALDANNKNQRSSSSSNNNTKPNKQTMSVALQKAAQSLGWRNRYSQNDHYPISMELLNDPNNIVEFTVQQIQRGEVEGTYGTGATVWPAAMILLKYLERHPHLVRGKRVVDLGSGTGVTSVAAAILGAAHVVCTDGEDSVVDLASQNCRAAVACFIGGGGGGGCPIEVQKYWWGTQPLPDDQCEVILVADCVLPKLYPIAPLVQAIDELLLTINNNHSNEETAAPVAILSYEHRYYPEYDPRTKFRELAQERGLVVKTIPLEQQDPVYSVEDVEIWHVTRRQ